MQCADVNECRERIRDYFEGPNLDHFLFVNVRNFADYQEVLRRQYDGGRECISVSDFCEEDDSLPFVEGAVASLLKKDNSVLSGLSQALMLRSEKKLDEVLNDVLFRPAHGHRAVILLLGCENYLKKFLARDQRLSRRVILVNGERSPQPKIFLSTDDFHLPSAKLVRGVKELLHHLERGGEGEFHLVSAMPLKFFSDSCYQVAKAPSAYEWLKESFHEIRDRTTASFGTDDEWKYLARQVSSCSNFTDFICKTFGNTINLSSYLKNVMRSGDATRKWLLWLALKVFYDYRSNNYLTRVLRSSESVADFPERVYLELANVDAHEKDFSQLYDERKILLDDLGKSYDLSEKYCKEIRSRKKDEIFYLTDRTKEEKTEFFRCLEEFDYSDAEILQAVMQMSEQLASYMEDYDFNLVMNGLTDHSPVLVDGLTAYFKEYKFQKLTNKIRDDFRDKVEKYAGSRPYNKFMARSKLIPKNLAKDRCRPFFIDALGVEYLGFILARCRDKYHMDVEISVGRCELPSTTEINKGYVERDCDSWGPKVPKINALDNIKHNDEEYNYERQKLPVHLFSELSVIDDQLDKIHSMMGKDFDKALIVSDHGASRLAVLYGKECDATIELDESGEKSGRCCRIDKEPNPPIKSAVYEGGYVVMANYERIRGGRRASVEVHGGASLEEVLVPVIVLSKKSDEIIRLMNSEFVLKRREDLSLELYFSGSLQQPQLYIEGQFFSGKLTTSHHAKFTIPDPKRKTYVAFVYDGEKNLGCKLEFTVKNASLASEKKFF